VSARARGERAADYTNLPVESHERNATVTVTSRGVQCFTAEQGISFGTAPVGQTAQHSMTLTMLCMHMLCVRVQLAARNSPGLMQYGTAKHTGFTVCRQGLQVAGYASNPDLHPALKKHQTVDSLCMSTGTALAHAASWLQYPTGSWNTPVHNSTQFVMWCMWTFPGPWYSDAQSTFPI